MIQNTSGLGEIFAEKKSSFTVDFKGPSGNSQQLFRLYREFERRLIGFAACFGKYEQMRQEDGLFARTRRFCERCELVIVSGAKELDLHATSTW